MGSVDRISVYQKRFLEDLDPGDIQDKLHIFAVESKVIPNDLTEFADLFREFISEESFIIPPEIWRSWDWLFFKEMLLMKCVKNKVQIFDLQLGDSGEFKVVVVGFKDEINPVCQKILNFLKAQNTASESVSFGRGEKELLSFYLQTSDLSKPKALDEGLSLKYKVCDSRIEITGTKANVQRATREIQRVISKCSTHSQSKNPGLNISIEPFKHFKVVICSGRDNIHLSSESLIVQSSSHEILFDGTDQGKVVGELSEITLTVKEGLSELGKLQKVIRLHWQCKFNKKNHTEVLEAAVIKALEYVKTQGQTLVSICCPLDKDLNTSIQAATVAAALEGFCKAQSYLFVSSLTVFIVCPNETEWANILKKNLDIFWACSNSKQNGMQEVIPVIPQNMSVRLVGGTLEENQVQAFAVPVTVSSKTKSIELSCLCAHKSSYNLEEFLQIRSPCLADTLQNGEIIPVTCSDTGLLCEYLYLIEVQDDWEDPAEVMEGIKRSEEPLGICFADHPFFIQYLQDSNQAFMEIFLNMEKTSSSFTIFKKSKQHCLSISKQEYISADMSLAKWKIAQANVYNCLRRRYNVKKHHIPKLPQVEKYEPNLKKLQSIKIYEHDTWVVGLTEEVNEYIRIADLNRHVEETISNEIWGDLTAKAIQHVTEDFQLELDACFPTVIASQDTMVPPNIIFLGPYKTVYSAIDVFKMLISKALLCVSLSDKLSDYKYAFLKSWNLSALSQKLFHSRYIGVTLTEQDNSLMMQGDSFEDNQQAMEVLKDDIYEAAIRISRASHTSTKGEKWIKQLEDILHRLNTNEQNVEIHTIQDKDNINCMVVVVGFKTEVHAAKRILNQYFQQNTGIKRILEFKQPSIVEAGGKLLDIIDKKDLFGAKVEVNVHTNSKVDIVLSGTRCEVQKAQETLQIDLDYVIKKSVKIEGLGAAHYFQDPETAKILKRIGLTYFCIISTRRQCMASKWPNDQKNYPLIKIYEGLTEPVEFDLIGRPFDIENAIKALQSHFQDCQTENMICDPQIEKLTQSQLHAVTKDLSVILHLTNNGLSLKGLKSHVDEAQTRLGEMLKTDKVIKHPEEQNVIKQTISCNIKGPINNTVSNTGLDWLTRMRDAAKPSSDSGKNTSPSIKHVPILNANFGQLDNFWQTTSCIQDSAVPMNTRVGLPLALLTDSKENLHQHGEMSSSGVTYAVPSNNLFDLQATNLHQQLYPQPNHVPGHIPILNESFGQMNNFWQTTSSFQDSAVLTNTRVGLPLDEQYFSTDAEEKQNKTTGHDQANVLVDFTSPRPSPLPSSFTCNFPGCSLSFDTLNGLQSHYRQMHTPEGRAKCRKCGKESTKSGITQHEKACMGNSFSYIPKATPSPSIQSMQYDSGLGTMSHSFTFADLPSIVNNYSIPVTPISNQNYHLEPKNLLNIFDLNSGIRQNNTQFQTPSYTKAFTCFCGRSFDSQRGLSSHHTQIHTANGRATCPSCGLESTKSGITRHKCKKR
ncbi:PAR14 polymerase, partial [Polypterus senegalus]|nr:PAR14 polymerase [Polypterus senegalus]